MALANLSPWPPTSSAATRAAARECLQYAIAETLTDDRLDALGEAASAVVERFAPDAPQAIRNEAVIRLAAFMDSRKPRPVQSVTAGGIRLNFREPKYSENVFAHSRRSFAFVAMAYTAGIAG